MKTSLWLVVVLLVLSINIIFIHGQKFSQRRRRSKEIEDRINKLGGCTPIVCRLFFYLAMKILKCNGWCIDDATKARINAMKASGMPHDAIAEKVAYETGGKSMAKRIVDAMSSDNSDYTKKQKTDKVKEDMKKKIDKAVKTEKTKAAEKAAKSAAKGTATKVTPAAKVTPATKAAKVTPPANVKTAKKATTSSTKNIKTNRK